MEFRCEVSAKDCHTFWPFGPQDISRGYKAAMFRAEGDDEFSVKDDALEIVDYVDLHQLAI